jgi:hypothetical protein
MLPLEPEQIARALGYTVDAERDPMPAGSAVSWEKVKAELTRGVQQWEHGRAKRARTR